MNFEVSVHEHFMQQALQQAREAAACGEVPVGALVVKNGEVIGRGRNSPLSALDPTAHAEVLALREAAQTLGNYRLEGCTLYVTLEPCTMCCGAMLHARVDCVVYGATEPKTGAAGSVLNVFGYPEINHQTQVVRGVLAQDCAALLADFFQQRRKEKKALEPHPLQDWALRNTDAAFAGFKDWPWLPQWRSDLPALKGLRMAVVDEGPVTAPQTWLCLHGSPAWGYAFRHVVNEARAKGHRVIVPDLPGFGRSDQPKKPSLLTADSYAQVLKQLLQSLDLHHVVLVGQGDGGRLGLQLAQAMPERFEGAWLLDTWPLAVQPEKRQQWFAQAARKPGWSVAQAMQTSHALAAAEPDAQEALAWNTPFAQGGHRAALQAWPRVQTELAAVPAALVATWAARHKIWLQASETAIFASENDWQAAWIQAVPQLAQCASVWPLTQPASLVPGLSQGAAAAAVEYFAP